MAQFLSVQPCHQMVERTKNWTLWRCVVYNFSEHRQTLYGIYSISRITRRFHARDKSKTKNFSVLICQYLQLQTLAADTQQSTHRTLGFPLLSSTRCHRNWQCCDLETMVSRLGCTRVHFVQVSVSVSRPEDPPRSRSWSRDLKYKVSVLVSRPKKVLTTTLVTDTLRWGNIHDFS